VSLTLSVMLMCECHSDVDVWVALTLSVTLMCGRHWHCQWRWCVSVTDTISDVDVWVTLTLSVTLPLFIVVTVPRILFLLTLLHLAHLPLQ